MRPIFFVTLLVGLGMGAISLFAVPPKKLPLGPPTAAELAAGETLAERLRSSPPDGNSEFHGKLIIESNDVAKEIPIVCRVTVGTTNWRTDYEVSATAQTGAERLDIIHSGFGSNQYLYARAAKPADALAKPAPVLPDDAFISLAGSDFSLADLGLDFLQWPIQRQLPGEMHLGQPCYILESSNPGPWQIVRVKSAIDKESGGLMVAEAYDAQGNMVKKFSLHGSSFKKVNGHYQVEKMEIRNVKTGSRTELKFDLTD